MDNENNEVEGISITNTPVLRYYKAGDKSKFEEFHGKDKTIEDLKKFLSENSEAYKKFRAANPEPVPEEKTDL